LGREVELVRALLVACVVCAGKERVAEGGETSRSRAGREADRGVAGTRREVG
jgi:hypothetical protein